MATVPGTLGAIIREARVVRNLTLRELARRIDKSPSYVSDIELDRRIPAEDVIRRISEELGLDLDAMMARAGRVGNDAADYIRRHPTAGVLFRKLSGSNLSKADLDSLLKEVDRLNRKKAS